MKNNTIYDDLDEISEKDTVSKEMLINVLKKYCMTISVFDLMDVTNELMEDTKYVQEEYRKKTNEIYIKYFLGRIKTINDDKTRYSGKIDKKDFMKSISRLKIHHKEESKTSKTKFPLIYTIVSLYTTFIIEESIHPVRTPFPGSLKVEKRNGVYYCPVKESNRESPNAVCDMCIARQM